ncbi:hypothetical protein AB6A40_004137 [Gnathostoma spinigerum]|uniref:Uncharacterized protein n=1 Tax=Gnathostoma spinigerum TaxID=75299 RepID=A0ABD6EKD7_9BILA
MQSWKITFSPGLPSTGGSPGLPFGPGGPFAPSSPSGPDGPAGQMIQGGSIGSATIGPSDPFFPSAPLSPSLPFLPGGPSGPGSPADPWKCDLYNSFLTAKNNYQVLVSFLKTYFVFERTVILLQGIHRVSKTKVIHLRSFAPPTCDSYKYLL